MAQPNLGKTSGKIQIVDRKLNKKNLINHKPTQAGNMKTVVSEPKDKFQCTFFHQRFSGNLKRKCSLDKIPSFKDPFSDSDSEADNIKNVVRWLETLPSNQDWCKLEEDQLDRQGDFGKEKSSNNENLTKFDPSQPSTSYKKNPWESKSSENNLLKTVKNKSKRSTGKVKVDKLKFNFKGTSAEIHGENPRYSKLEQKSRLKTRSDRLGKMKNPASASTSRADNRRCSSDNANAEEKLQTRRHSYNLRNLESRKNGMIDPEEKNTGARRTCSIRCQENRRRSREVPSTNGSDRSEFRQMENLNPARKLKSPFTKQAKSNTLGLLSEMPYLSSFNSSELKEMEKNFQNLDKGSENQTQLDRKIIIRSKLENNKKLLNTIKEIVNIIDSNHDSIHKPVLFRKSRKTGYEKIDDSRLTISKQSSEELRRKMSKLNNSFKDKPSFVNSKLEKKLNKAMEVTVNKYKRSYGNRETTKKQSFDQAEEPPKKKKKFYCKI